ncbi:MAG: Hsp20/alpha crystallin family protein [Magnetococcales bacterium]|nr:Hsp20/alpha crystallin family protein [Magnetococcales bacterium]
MHTPVNHVPLRHARSLQQEINRLFSRDVEESHGTMTQWSLRVDIREEAEQILLQADIPGVDPKDIKIHIENNQLTISGERKWADGQKPDTYHRIERAYGSFSRTFQLGGNANPDQIQASCKNGVLAIRLPKRAGTKPPVIEVPVH